MNVENRSDEEVSVVKDLGTGYVRVSSASGRWAQLEKSTWDALLSGDLIPFENTFEPAWGRLIKPAASGAEEEQGD